MPMETVSVAPGVDTMAERIEVLERANRWLQRVAAGLFVLIFAVGQESYRSRSHAGRVLDVGRLVIRDKAGRARGTLGFDQLGLPGLKLFDERGREQAALEVPGDGRAALTLSQRGRPCLVIDAASDGGAAVRMFDAARGSSSVLFLGADGAAGLTFNRGLSGLTMGVQSDAKAGLFAVNPGVPLGRLGDPAVSERGLGLSRGQTVPPGPEPGPDGTPGPGAASAWGPVSAPTHTLMRAATPAPITAAD